MSFHRPTRSLSVFREEYILQQILVIVLKRFLHLSVIINKESFIVVIKFGLSSLFAKNARTLTTHKSPLG